jgi:hypothetical protein
MRMERLDRMVAMPWIVTPTGVLKNMTQEIFWEMPEESRQCDPYFCRGAVPQVIETHPLQQAEGTC